MSPAWGGRIFTTESPGEIQLWAFCPILIHDLSLPGICPPTPSRHLLGVCSKVHEISLSKMCLSAHTCIHALQAQTGAHSLPRLPLPSAHIQPQASLSWSVCNPRGLPLRAALCSFLLQLRKLMSVGVSEAPPCSSQMLLQRLQELLRQGNASDVVPRVQAMGTNEVPSLPCPPCCWDYTVSSSGSC